MPRPTPANNRRKYTSGTIPENRESWLNVHTLETILYIGGGEDSPYEIEVEGAEMHRLALRIKGRAKPLWLNLTALTVEELDALQSFINRAIDKARPSCQLIDKEATRRYEEEDDDSYARIYRQAPQLVIRERKSGQHRQSVQSGSEGADGIPTTGGGLPEPGDTSGDISDTESPDMGTSDDES